MQDLKLQSKNGMRITWKHLQNSLLNSHIDRYKLNIEIVISRLILEYS